jgi:Domain of unknown function (DUF4157)
MARQFDHKLGPAGTPAVHKPDATGPAGNAIADEGHPLLRLQRMAGNRVAQRAVHQYRASRRALAPAVVATLRVGPADDRHERDADRAAEHAADGSVPLSALAARRASTDHGGVVLPEVQRAITHAARTSGQPIPAPARAPLEQAMGAEFGEVRVHADQRADELARSLQAKAFTTGRDIFFRRGQYEPSNRAGQRVLAHELTHVVQQTAAGRAGGEALVQRLLGFEFETDWGIHGIKNPAKNGTAKKPAKHTVYKECGDFTVQVDEAHRGFNPGYEGLSRQIEFVVKPHEETDEGADRLLRTMRSLKAEAQGLDQLRERRKGAETGFKYPGANRNLWVFPDAKDTAVPKIHARAQATVGLTLPAISTFAQLPPGEPAKTRTGGYIFTHARREASLGGHRGPFAVGAQAASQIKNASAELSGLVSLLVLYIKVFHDPTAQKEDYVKGYLPLLAKTDFATMFSNLPDEEQKKYRKNKSSRKKFADLVLKSVTADPTYQAVTKKMQVIPDSQMPGDTSLGLTLQDWLSSIAGGEDKLTSKTDPRLFGLGDLGEDVNKGKLTDPAPDTGSPRMILEFRGGSVGAGPKGGGGFLTPAEWIEFAFDYFNLIRQVHGYGLVPEWEEFRPPPPPQAQPKAKAKTKKTKLKAKAQPNTATTSPRRRTRSLSESS